jgi:hypothetical protein
MDRETCVSRFEDFEREYGPPGQGVVPGDATLRAYAGVLPFDLLEHWHRVGWCSYRDGLLWLVDPGQFVGIVEDWTDLGPPTPLVFLRSGFAHLWLWHDGYVYSLDVQRGGISRVTSRLERMFTLLCDPQIQEKILLSPLFEKVLAVLGPPGSDECYGFEPALALGGPGTVETVRRVKIREHLGILAQLHH